MRLSKIKKLALKVPGATASAMAALKMECGRGLVAQYVVSDALPPLCPGNAVGVPGSLRDDASLFRDRERAPDVANPLK